ncbi:hypothetical protein EON81_23845, partial [bacterium]
MVGSLLLRLPIRLPVAGSLMAIFSTWGAATTLFANGDIGRSLYAPVQYYVVWGFFGIFIYAAVEMGVNLAPSMRKFIVIPWLLIFAFSGIIGLLQMMGVGFALALSPTQAFGIIFRPTGITDYTFLLGMQGVFGMALIGSRLIARDLKFWEWIALGGFMVIILIAQYRSLYYTGLLLMGVAVLFLQFRRNRAKAIGLVIPELDGKLDGSSQRVPVSVGSVVELFTILEKRATVSEINSSMQLAANESFGYTEDEIVSADIIGMSYGSLFDASQTNVVTLGDQQLVKTVSWYDNEMSFV